VVCKLERQDLFLVVISLSEVMFTAMIEETTGGVWRMVMVLMDG
jgi:hypothetical protein